MISGVKCAILHIGVQHEPGQNELKKMLKEKVKPGTPEELYDQNWSQNSSQQSTEDCMKTFKTHTWMRAGALAGMLTLSPLVFSNGSSGENLVQLNEATCTTCCPEENSICVGGHVGFYDLGSGVCP